MIDFRHLMTDFRHCERSEAIHLSTARKNGLLRGVYHRAALRADPLARNDG
jgi:hypothetical protein